MGSLKSVDSICRKIIIALSNLNNSCLEVEDVLKRKEVPFSKADSTKFEKFEKRKQLFQALNIQVSQIDSLSNKIIKLNILQPIISNLTLTMRKTNSWLD